MVVYCDSTGAIALSKNPISRRATKHIELRWHYVRQCVEAGQLRLVHERTDRNRADAYTKGLPTTTFIKHRDTMLRPYVKPVNPTCYDPDELEQTRLQQAHLCYKMNNYHVSKHAESLFVPRPDGQHKGSNESDLHSRLILYRALQRHRAQLVMDLARMNAAEHRLLSPAQFSTEQELFKINKVSVREERMPATAVGEGAGDLAPCPPVATANRVDDDVVRLSSHMLHCTNDTAARVGP